MSKAKGSRTELELLHWLEDYCDAKVCKAGASLGLLDLVASLPGGVRLEIQAKTNRRIPKRERYDLGCYYSRYIWPHTNIYLQEWVKYDRKGWKVWQCVPDKSGGVQWNPVCRSEDPPFCWAKAGSFRFSTGDHLWSLGK